ncbi:PKD domain-containing protein [Microbulbifer agarilyticus]|uniref:PKD domain-containing protein n=1 Tax=Microbulbifer agarilyticus TaxID=260552 RepID=UPI001CD20873|nr:hypothetical protein [Microbulbifer agarilyticus]MCA0899159.1 hypothetical protein [Microbulbifer agarilyticus]
MNDTLITLAKTTVLSTCLLLHACGGGGSGGGASTPEPTNLPPTVSAASATIAEGTTTTIVASAADSDGTIASYTWEQKSGVALTLSNTDSDTVSITAPSVTEDSEAVITITVTDNSGATASQDVLITVTANLLSLVIEGRVIAPSLETSSVEFRVGEEVFSAPITASGDYSVPLNIDESRSEEMVRATTSDGSGQNLLVSLMGSVASLHSAAGEDGLLTRDEHLSVNISPVSTAFTAQLEQGVPQSISSEAVLGERMKRLDGNAALQLAVLITLIVDDADGVALDLPAGINSTYALAAKPESISEFVVNTQLRHTTAYLNALALVASHEDLSSSAVARVNNTYADTYYLTTAGIQSIPFAALGSHFVDLGYKLTLNTEGQGNLIGRLGDTTLSWAAGEDGITLSGAEFVTDEETFWDADLGKGVVRQTVVAPSGIRWLNQANATDWLLVTVEEYFRYPDGEYPSTEPEVHTGAMLAVRQAGTIPAHEVIEVGLNYSLPLGYIQGNVESPAVSVPNPDFSIRATQMMFTGDVDTGGSATYVLDQINGEGIPASTLATTGWSINNEGQLKLNDVYGNTVEVTFLENTNIKDSLTHVTTTNDVRRTAMTSNTFVKEASDWTSSEAVGIYRLPDDFYYPNSPYWIEVNADGTALTVIGYDSNPSNDTAITDSFVQMPGFWQINANGNLVIRRYRQYQMGYCEPDSWNPAASDSCLLYNEREWVLQQNLDNNAIGVQQYTRFFEDAFRDPSSGIEVNELRSSSIANYKFERISERPYTINN